MQEEKFFMYSIEMRTVLKLGFTFQGNKRTKTRTLGEGGEGRI